MMTQMEGNRTFTVIPFRHDNAWLTCVFTQNEVWRCIANYAAEDFY